VKFDVKRLSKGQQIGVLLAALVVSVALFALTFAACSNSVMKAIDEEADVSVGASQETTAVAAAEDPETFVIATAVTDEEVKTTSKEKEKTETQANEASKQDSSDLANAKKSTKSGSGAKDNQTPAATPAQSSSSKPAVSAPRTITVTIAIDARTAYAKDPEAVSGFSNAGVILSAKKITLPEGANVKQALEASGVRFNARGAYISGIGGLSEGDLGPKSGWLYSVNGTFPSVSCTNYQLKAGDSVAWRYTCNQGEDVGSPR
jgi:hypothetical protein